MTNKFALRYNLEKDAITRILSNRYAYAAASVDINVSHEACNQIAQLLGPYSAFLTNKNIDEGQIISDFLYLTPLYMRTGEENENGKELKYPNICSARYKGFLLNAIRYINIHGYGRYTYPFSLAHTQEDVFIGNGLILDKSFRVLFAIKGDVIKEEGRTKFINPYCIIDRRVFEEKSTVNNFIKNTLFPTLLELGYHVEIDNFRGVELFEHPTPPQSYDNIKEEITEVLTDNLDKVL